MKVVIVGAIAGGSTVAAQIRRAVPESEITLFGRDPVLGYGTCGMPYVIGGLIDEKSKLFGASPEEFGDCLRASLGNRDRSHRVTPGRVRDLHDNLRSTYRTWPGRHSGSIRRQCLVIERRLVDRGDRHSRVPGWRGQPQAR